MTSSEQINELFWRMVHIIEPVTRRHPSMDASLPDVAFYRERELVAKAKAAAILEAMRGEGLLPQGSIIPSPAAPY